MITYPLDLVKTQQQLKTSSPSSSISTVQLLSKILKTSFHKWSVVCNSGNDTRYVAFEYDFTSRLRFVRGNGVDNNGNRVAH